MLLFGFLGAPCGGGGAPFFWSLGLFVKRNFSRDGKNQAEKPRGRLKAVFGGEMATAKIQMVKGSEWRFFRVLCEKILLGLDGLDRRNGIERGLLSVGGYAILKSILTGKR